MDKEQLDELCFPKDRVPDALWHAEIINETINQMTLLIKEMRKDIDSLKVMVDILWEVDQQFDRSIDHE